MFQGTAAIALALVMAVDPTSPATSPATPSTASPPRASAPAEAVAEGPTVEAGAAAPVAAAPVEPEPAEVAPAPAAPMGPVVGPTAAVDAPTPFSLRPPPPPYDGRGLLIAAGVMGALNVGIVGARLGLGLGEVNADKERARLLLTAVATPIDLAAGIGLAAGGGYLRGRSDGYRTAYDRQPKLRSRAFTGSGLILLAMGAVAWASAWTPWYGDPSLDARGNGTLVVESIGSLLFMSGSGLLAYGLSWQKHTTLYSRTTRPVALRPALAPGFAGLAVTGRF
jgi:hypothetical protein